MIALRLFEEIISAADITASISYGSNLIKKRHVSRRREGNLQLYIFYLKCEFTKKEMVAKVKKIR